MTEEITPLTDTQIEAILQQWQTSGEGRLANFNASFSEEDYIAGAMAVFFALDSQDKIPASWAFFGLSHRSHFRKSNRQQEMRDRMVRFMSHINSVMSCLQSLLEIEPDLEHGQTRRGVQEDILTTIQLVDPTWMPRGKENNE